MFPCIDPSPPQGDTFEHLEKTTHCTVWSRLPTTGYLWDSWTVCYPQYCPQLCTELYCIVHSSQYCNVLSSAVQYSTALPSAVQYITVKYCPVLYSTVLYSAKLYRTALLSAVQYSTALLSAVQY